jgi:dUTP pyrophosphatase
MLLFCRIIGGILERAGLMTIPSKVEVQIKLDPGAKIPTQPYSTDACWDLYALEDVWVRPGIATYIPTGVYINIPVGYEGELKARSSHGKEGLFLHHGAFDAGYQGEVAPFMINFTTARLEVQKGDRIAQFCLRCKFPVEWKCVTGFTPSIRGVKGHGSSGR